MGANTPEEDDRKISTDAVATSEEHHGEDIQIGNQANTKMRYTQTGYDSRTNHNSREHDRSGHI